MGDRFCKTRQVKKSSRKNTTYDLSFVQQPKCAKIVGFGHKIDRSPINPAPVIQLNVINPSGSPSFKNSGSFPSDTMVDDSIALQSDQDEKENIQTENQPRSKSQSFLQNPYYFMNATLTNATPDAKTGVYQDLHASKDGKTRFLVGSTVSSLYQLQIQYEKDIEVFVFPDLSVRQEGEYRVRFDLYEILGKEIHVCRSILSEVFQAYTPRQPLVTDQRVEPTNPLTSSSSRPRIRNNNLTAKKIFKPSRQHGHSPESIIKPLPGGDTRDGDYSSLNLVMMRSRRRSVSPDRQGVDKRVRVAEVETERLREKSQTARSTVIHDEGHVLRTRGSAGIEIDPHGLSHDVAPQHHDLIPSFSSTSSTPFSTSSLLHTSLSRSSHQSDDSPNLQSSSHSPTTTHQPTPPAPPAPPALTVRSNEHSPDPISGSFKSVGSALVGEHAFETLAPLAHSSSDSSHPLFYRNHHPHHYFNHHAYEQSSNVVLPPIHLPPTRKPLSPSSSSSLFASHSSYHLPLLRRSNSNETIPDDRQSSNINRQSPIGWTSRTTNSSFSGRLSVPSSSASLDRSSSNGSNMSCTFSPAIGHVGGGPVLKEGEHYTASPLGSNTRVIPRTVDSSMAPPGFARYAISSGPRTYASGAGPPAASLPAVAEKKDSRWDLADPTNGPGRISPSAAAVTAIIPTAVPSPSILSSMATGERKTFPGLGLKEMLNPSSEGQEKITSCCHRHPSSEGSHKDLSAPSDPANAPSFSASRIGLYNLLS